MSLFQIVFGSFSVHYSRLLAFSLLFISSITFLHGQSVLSGKVIDAESGEPLLGATLLVISTAEGAVTDFDGAFELRTQAEFPLQLQVTYVGYDEITLEVTAPDKNMKIELGANSITIDAVEIKGQRISDKQKSSPLTVESLDVLAIKETPSDNFYDGLGSLKGVDLTAASLGFKVINTRGFNSTSPVRTLQLIDGVDNQAPGLNFSLGNFLGSSELDVLKVDLIQGASSAFYGPNAFNGVISMTTKNPFASKGLSARVKTGERNLFESAIRWADVFNNKEGKPVVGYKFNFSYLRADDWEADNYDPVDGTETGIGNPGRYDAVNIYGDEYSRFFDYGGGATTPWGDFAGLGQFHRTGYREIDMVDYDTRNLKASTAWHFRLKPDEGFESPEIIASTSFGTGTTVYQGDNRFSLRDILFFQHRLEYKKTDKFFIRLYATQQDAGNSYDPYFTALRLQDRATDNAEWGATYTNYWLSNIRPKFEDLGYPELEFGFDEMGNVIVTFDNEAADQWMMTYQDSLTRWHNLALNFANQLGSNRGAFLQPGTPEFEEAFNEITSAKSNAEEEGTGFFDRSALYHGQGEYKFEFGESTVLRTGASGRLYTPRSDGTIFYDTAGIRITNYEFGLYGGVQQQLWDNRVTASATLRVDKNQNFPWLASPAASVVYKPKPNNYLRVSFSSAIRNPTLTDQFLFLNVGPATLAGNLEGVDSLITINSFLDFIDSQTLDTLEYFNIGGVRPERVQTIEFGYRTTLWNKLYVDLGTILMCTTTS
jgi:iron complex outermembrane receptor protein